MGQQITRRCTNCKYSAKTIDGGLMSCDLKPMVCISCKEVFDTVTKTRKREYYLSTTPLYHSYINKEMRNNIKFIFLRMKKWETEKRWNKKQNKIRKYIIEIQNMGIEAAPKKIKHIDQVIEILSKTSKVEMLKEGSNNLIVCPLCKDSIERETKTNHIQEHKAALIKLEYERQRLELERSENKFTCSACGSELLDWDKIHCPKCTSEMVIDRSCGIMMVD